MTELAADMEQIHYVVVGIGVNANLSELEEMCIRDRDIWLRRCVI